MHLKFYNVETWRLLSTSKNNLVLVSGRLGCSVLFLALNFDGKWRIMVATLNSHCAIID